MRTGTGVVVFREHAAERGADAEKAEVVSRHEQRGSGEGFAAIREAGFRRPRRGEAGEGRLLRLQIAEHRIAEGRTAVLVGRHAALQRPGVVQEDEAIRILHGKPPQQGAIDQREHRGIGADAQRERQDRREREERRPRQRAKNLRHAIYLRRSDLTSAVITRPWS